MRNLFQHYNYNESLESSESKNNDNVMSVGEWIGVLIILAVPVLNILIYDLWAFGGGINKNLQNFCKATLIVIAIGIVLGVLLS